MTTIDAGMAQAAVVEFLELLDRLATLSRRNQQRQAPRRVLGSIPEDTPHSAIATARREIDAVEKALHGLQPLIEKIAQEIDPDDDPRRFGTWADAKIVAQRILGILENQPLHDGIFGSRGPSLAASRLHPWVWNAAVDLWGNGHQMEAVLNSAKAVEKHTQLKIGSTLSGQDLYAHAFSTKDGSHPRLRFTDLTPETDAWRSAHDGARFLGMGCAQGIRNWAAHSTDDVSEQQALEYLAALSVLARWIDTAEVDMGPSANAA